MRPLVGHCHRGLGVLCQRVEALDRARREFGMARDLYREMDMTFWRERTDAELVKLR
jgi:hypothetical protein